ncbi:MAG: chemotaxis protein CheX [Calditerrivibrio sp.]|nr:chemotaxis protein CheX [Calditerrivibrio sp.]
MEYKKIIDIITEKCIDFIEKDLSLNPISKKIYLKDVPKINLNYLTSIMSIKGHITAIVVFSYEKAILDKIFYQFTKELDVKDDEKDELYAESACEVMNIVLGNSTKSLEINDSLLSFSPPLIVNEAKSILNKKDSKYYHSMISTTDGNINIYLIIQDKQNGGINE